LTHPQLSDYESIDPEDSIVGRIQAQLAAHGGQLANIARKLGVTWELSAVFPEQPPKTHLHIIVQTPVIGQGSPTLVDNTGVCAIR